MAALNKTTINILQEQGNKKAQHIFIESRVVDLTLTSWLEKVVKDNEDMPELSLLKRGPHINCPDHNSNIPTLPYLINTTRVSTSKNENMAELLLQTLKDDTSTLNPRP